MVRVFTWSSRSYVYAVRNMLHDRPPAVQLSAVRIQKLSIARM
jgi:hypothetical protein